MKNIKKFISEHLLGVVITGLILLVIIFMNILSNY